MLFALLLFGTPWFWMAAVLPFLFLIWFVENERAIGAVLTLIITAAVFVAFGDKQIIPWVVAHPLNIAEYVAGYIVVGILWGIVKWFFHVLRARDRYEKVREQFAEDEKTFRAQSRKEKAEREFSDKAPKMGVHSSVRDAEYREGLAAYVKEAQDAPVQAGFDKELFGEYARRKSINLGEFPPRASHNKGRIIFWMSYWPASALWTLINDPITRLYRFLFKRLTAVFEGISNSMFAKYKDDMAPPVETK